MTATVNETSNDIAENADGIYLRENNSVNIGNLVVLADMIDITTFTTIHWDIRIVNRIH